ncbi:MAG: 2-hydroxyacyl-CoA dehydratase family protein [Candidatus Hydrogenedentes bacterium]|nr:2-hydroxyacyl-CoA dehydratase family protein [Candidatus Hydrogenedentota bacterium]
MSVEISELLKPFYQVFEDLYRFAKDAKTDGEKVAGYFCTYSPQELLHSAGYFPVRVIGGLGATPLADQWLQPFACSFAKSALQAGLSGDFSFLDLVMFSHTCDTMQNLAEIWRRRVSGLEVVIVSTPNLTEGDIPLNYLMKELERVKEELERISKVQITEDRLLKSIEVYERHRSNMKSLYALRRKNPSALNGEDMFAIVMSSFLMKKEAHNEMLENLIQSLKALPVKDVDKPKVLVGGSVCQVQGFIEAIESAGAFVCDDDLCMGSRSYVLPPIYDGNPTEILARMYLSRVPCPAFHKPGHDPASYLLDRVVSSGAKGVVFLQTKFCDPYAFNYPHLRRTLEKEGIRTLLIEVEQNQPVSEAFKTRISAFLETLQ